MGVRAERRAFSPAGADERIEIIDALRGIAILGILVANLERFRTPEVWVAQAKDADPVFERVFDFLVAFLAEGKFISALAFLLGFGLATQASRATAAGRPARRFLAKRIFVLALFGLAHAVLIWSGDVLLFYALLGFPFLLFVRRRPKTLVVWTVISVAPLLLIALALAVFAIVDPAGVARGEAPSVPSLPVDLSGPAERAYNSGSYLEMVAQRIFEYFVTLPLSLLLSGPPVFAMMLLGAAAANAGWTGDREGLLRRRARRAALWGLLVGLPLNFFYAFASGLDPMGVSYLYQLGAGAWLVGAPALALGWMGLAVLLLGKVPAVLLRLAAVGRMALTNYLMQSVIMTAVFYGLGLYGNASVGLAVAIMAAVWVLELTWSRPWLARYSYGPAEWIWRRLTYGRRPTPAKRPGSS